jgi:GGDEF domain-containing protein
VLERVARAMRELAGPWGLPARTAADRFTVLLPGMNQREAWQQVERVLGRPSRIEFEAGRHEIVLVPEIAAEHVARDGESALDLGRELAGELARRRHYEERRRTWLRRERERHSRPMPLA